MALELTTTEPGRTARVGPPRLDANERLIHRLYESLILFKVIAPNRGSHATVVEDRYSLQFVRRRFLRNLAYVCDYEKGGHTTTAVAIEENYGDFNFWVSCNTDPAKKTAPFLRSVLELLQAAVSVGDGGQHDLQAELSLTEMCIDFAKKRIRKESASLLRAVRFCQSIQSDDNGQSRLKLVAWLRQFENTPNLLDLCQLAYNVRASVEVRELESHSWSPMTTGEHDGAAQCFSSAKHYIGRLAHHIRAPKQLLEDAHRLQRLLDSFKVCPIPVTRSVAQPTRDAHTTLEGILRRMLPAQDERFSELFEILSDMDMKTGIFNEVLDYYEPGKLKPQVHAEIYVLEHFFRNQLSYLDGDKYIGCSKPACLCCTLYIRYHPARCIEPESHQKVYTNWGPLNLPDGRDDPNFLQQRKLITSITQRIREEVIDQILSRRSSRMWRPDSLSGITSSAVFL